ncbi:MAG: hypothetical protein AB1Z98_31095 [Nannocystaceae bacterium]
MGWTLALAVLGLWPAHAQAGRLESVRSEVSGSSSSSSDDSSSSSSSSDDDDDDYGSGASLSSDAITPRPRAPRRYRHYPYEGGTRDYMFVPRPDDTRARKRAAQVWGEGAWQGRGLWRSAGGLRIDGQIFSLDGDLSYYLEPAANDALYLGTLNLGFIPIKERRAVVRIGGGMNTMIDGRVPGEGPREYALGWNASTSFDLFPAWPVVVSGRIDAGRLYQAFMGRARGTVGVMLWRMELYGGYEHTQVGRVGLGGPTVGVRLWI